MQRDLTRLLAAADRVQSDLRRTTGRDWTCTLDSQLVLTVSDGTSTEQVLLEPDVEDEAWYAPDGATAAELVAGLDAEADELLATEVAEALRAAGTSWPVCREHGRVMGNCTGWWYCPGDPGHDVAEAGSLPDARATVR